MNWKIFVIKLGKLAFACEQGLNNKDIARKDTRRSGAKGGGEDTGENGSPPETRTLRVFFKG